MRIITKKGYALIEVIITLAILGAVAMPLAMFLQSVISKSLND
jgi:prepilin-type N-terminal cleavage/methylation domain-containing protein